MAATLDDIAALLTEQNSLLRRLLAREQIDMPAPPSNDPWDRVRTLAKTDPRASMEEAKRLSKEDSLRRREEKKRQRAAA